MCRFWGIEAKFKDTFVARKKRHFDKLAEDSRLINAEQPFRFTVFNCLIDVGLEKPWGIFKPYLVYMIKVAKPTNTPSLVEISSQVAPPHRDKILRICAWAIGRVVKGTKGREE